MKRAWLLLIIAAYPVWALAQSATSGGSAPYQPAVPAASNVNAYGNFWGYGSGGGTAAGSALNGMASVISAKGDYNLSTSAAAVNMTQAQRNEIQNRQEWTNTYFAMRETNRAARAAERGPAPTMEQIARMAKQGTPSPLSPSQVDPVTGRIHWPSALQNPAFEPQRADLDKVFASRATYGGLTYADQQTASEAIDQMFSGLKDRIREMPAPEYMACRNFLQSLSFAATQTTLD